MILYGAEIKLAIAGRKEPRRQDVQYCAGLRDFEHMGISTICAYDYELDQYRVFFEDNLQGFRDLLELRGTVIGFNNNHFDDRLCMHNGIQIEPGRSYDLLQEIWRAAGLGPDFCSATHGGYGLEAMARCNLGDAAGKSGNGALAPIWFQKRRIGQLVDYCMQDVWLLKRLMDRVLQFPGYLLSPKNGQKLVIRRPDEYLA